MSHVRGIIKSRYIRAEAGKMEVICVPKVFNTTAVCIPKEHYMVNLDERLKKIKVFVDAGKYFTINRARQYGKTTTLRALYLYLQGEYYVVSMDFQTFGSAEFQTETIFSRSFANSFLRSLKRNPVNKTEQLNEAMAQLEKSVASQNDFFALKALFEQLGDICAVSDKPIVLMIDEVDSASNNQVFLDFLAQLRAQYMERDIYPTFRSVILAGVYDVKNLRGKIRPEDEHKYNSPWNIAADFDISMSFSKNEIAGMLTEYEADYKTGMNVDEMAGLLFDDTSGYPFLVSRLCQLMDEVVCKKETYGSKSAAWTKEGFYEAQRLILAEKNMLFESLSEKLVSYPELNDMLKSLLFTGKPIVFNYYEPSIGVASMFGFVKNKNGMLVVANRIFETWLYNFYLSAADMQKKEIYAASLMDKNQFIVNGCLNMRLILEKFVVHFHDLYGDQNETFLEEEGRKYFLLYLRPIINGTGNYYIEAQTRGQKRTDVIVDYRGHQYVIEMKIWRGQEYNNRGEKQLAGYLDDYHVNKGYMVSFNFNRKKKTGIREIVFNDKVIIEAVV
ncbi:9-O-acetyl-N-acetylneuraminate esterase [Roseburia intestinalis]|uniref:9-O-acetyl-N-acetylneuraminate esterase n=2 Tax=Roseburia intestinalis TaxID=166486 RepID=A0A3R6KSL7_9FIRM|nr:9-O-acetyl-N-acetylneuraminate esterase [Roseburia intestinalis]